MNLKRFTRGPVLWIAIVVLLVQVFSSFTRGDGGYKKVSTSTVLTAISDHQVRKARVLDKEQRIEITRLDGVKQQASFLSDEGDEVAGLLNENKPADGWDVK